MADVSEVSINKEWDLNFLYDMAKQAVNSGDIKQSVKISERGLKEAKKINDNDMILKFNILHSDTKENYLKKRIDSHIKRANQEEKIFRYDKAVKFLKKAKKYLNQEFKLGKNNTKINKQIKKIDKKLTDLKGKDKLSTGIISEKESFPPKGSEITIESPIINPKEHIEEIDTSKFRTIEKNEETNEIINTFLKSEESSPVTQSIGVEPIQNDEYSSEKITKTKQKHLIETAIKFLKSFDYYIIPQNISQIKKIHKDIDILAIKIVPIKEFLELILIIPIKICKFKGFFIFSEMSFDYRSLDKKVELDNSIETVEINKNIQGLVESQNKIFQNLTNEGGLFQFFKKYLKLDITAEKTTRSRRLFFRSGPLQYKLLIEPILVCNNETGFIEKSIPFPYQKSSNLHAVSINKFAKLVDYINKKYTILETQKEEENKVETYFKSIDKLTADIRLYSIPFIIFGLIFSLIFVFQLYPLLRMFINLGIAALGLYSIMLIYMFLKFSKQKTEMINDFNTPYYQREVELDEADIYIINEELPNELLDQLIYECYGKKVNLDFLQIIEERRRYSPPSSKKNIEAEEFQEEQNRDNTDVPIFSSSGLNNRIIEKYSSFLED